MVDLAADTAVCMSFAAAAFAAASASSGELATSIFAITAAISLRDEDTLRLASGVLDMLRIKDGGGDGVCMDEGEEQIEVIGDPLTTALPVANTDVCEVLLAVAEVVEAKHVKALALVVKEAILLVGIALVVDVTLVTEDPLNVMNPVTDVTDVSDGKAERVAESVKLCRDVSDGNKELLELIDGVREALALPVVEMVALNFVVAVKAPVARPLTDGLFDDFAELDSIREIRAEAVVVKIVDAVKRADSRGLSVGSIDRVKIAVEREVFVDKIVALPVEIVEAVADGVVVCDTVGESVAVLAVDRVTEDVFEAVRLTRGVIVAFGLDEDILVPLLETVEDVETVTAPVAIGVPVFRSGVSVGLAVAETVEDLDAIDDDDVDTLPVATLDSVVVADKLTETVEYEDKVIFAVGETLLEARALEEGADVVVASVVDVTEEVADNEGRLVIELKADDVGDALGDDVTEGSVLTVAEGDARAERDEEAVFDASRVDRVDDDTVTVTLKECIGERESTADREADDTTEGEFEARADGEIVASIVTLANVEDDGVTVIIYVAREDAVVDRLARLDSVGSLLTRAERDALLDTVITADTLGEPLARGDTEDDTEKKGDFDEELVAETHAVDVGDTREERDTRGVAEELAVRLSLALALEHAVCAEDFVDLAVTLGEELAAGDNDEERDAREEVLDAADALELPVAVPKRAVPDTVAETVAEVEAEPETVAEVEAEPELRDEALADAVALVEQVTADVTEG